MIKKNLINLFGFPFHTLLFSIYPILYLYARNSVFIPGGDVVRPLVISVGFGIFFLAGFGLILRKLQTAGLLTSLLVVLILSFGHVFNQLEAAFPKIQDYSRLVSWLGWAWVVLFLLLSFLLTRIKSPAIPTQFLNIVSLVLVIFPLFGILQVELEASPFNQEISRENMAVVRHQRSAESAMFDLEASEKPDIYFIIFDAYERADKLNQFYGFDNSKFIAELKDRGFYVATDSRSNYMNTTYSLNTALNLVYFSDFPANTQRDAKLNLQTNYVSEFLRRQGYKIVVFDSGTGDSNNQYADLFITPAENTSDSNPILNPFETLALRTTIGLVFLKGADQPENSLVVDDVMAATVNRELDIRRGRIYSAFNHLPDYAGADSPHFLFAHIYLPHIPFLFGTDGKELVYQKNMNFYWYEPLPENFIEQYIYQIEYLNSAILPVIDRIQSESTRPVVIILQSDHGDDKFLDWDSPTSLGVDARSATLNAVYYSDGIPADFYPTVTTVNTFRLVFNHWFGTEYPLLQDRVFFHNHPLEQAPGEIPRFVDACTNFGVCIGKSKP